MVGEESLGDGGDGDDGVEMVPKRELGNGFLLGAGNEGSSGSESLRTYKRRRLAKAHSEGRSLKDERASVEAAGLLIDETARESGDLILWNDSHEQVGTSKEDCHIITNNSDDSAYRRWMNIVLEHMHKSSSESEGGILSCIQDAIAYHSEIDKNPVHPHEDKHKGTSQLEWKPNCSQNNARENADVLSNGILDDANITKLCQRTFFNVIISEKFTSLCKLLLENFPGIKVESFLDFDLINSRMKEGTYEHSPMLFSSDIQQVWRKLQRIGSELLLFAKSLSDMSRTSFHEQVGGSVVSVFEDKGHELCTWELDCRAKLEQAGACGAYNVCTCRLCGGKADGKDCLVCDSCEEMYHVSCIEPAVKEIPSRSWYCANCTASGIELSHGNCVVCERLNTPRSLVNGLSCDTVPKHQELNELEESSNGVMDDRLQILEGSSSLNICKICGSEVDDSEKFRLCGHLLCPSKYYHVRCLTSKQLKAYGPCWYCPSCLCRACLTDKDDDKIVLCDGCDHAYHIYCMKPPRTSVPRGKWFCKKCEAGILEIGKAKKVYEKLEKKKKMGSEEGRRAYKNFETKLAINGKDKGGVDMILTAAKALRNEERLAAIQINS